MWGMEWAIGRKLSLAELFSTACLARQLSPAELFGLVVLGIVAQVGNWASNGVRQMGVWAAQPGLALSLSHMWAA